MRARVDTLSKASEADGGEEREHHRKSGPHLDADYVSYRFLAPAPAPALASASLVLQCSPPPSLPRAFSPSSALILALSLLHTAGAARGTEGVGGAVFIMVTWQ